MYVIINKLVYKKRFTLIMIFKFKDDCNQLAMWEDCRCSTSLEVQSVINNFIYKPIKSFSYGVK